MFFSHMDHLPYRVRKPDSLTRHRHLRCSNLRLQVFHPMVMYPAGALSVFSCRVGWLVMMVGVCGTGFFLGKFATPKRYVWKLLRWQDWCFFACFLGRKCQNGTAVQQQILLVDPPNNEKATVRLSNMQRKRILLFIAFLFVWVNSINQCTYMNCVDILLSIPMYYPENHILLDCWEVSFRRAVTFSYAQVDSTERTSRF